ncbi:vacuolar protein sorting-associated protein 37A-like [Sipha flava]|uniref:Vacuolar protein sorting-associated protein 37A n=1 Tax=Sipha flava TaxID=143950 RepID=A0A2S2QVI3_9HEMI|nr:vacuolar protein sorting-associated protein 37A-like [Sipha flava]
MLSTNLYNSHDLTRKREIQIDTLKVFNENVTEKIFDKEYFVEFPTRIGSLRMIIDLGPKFPLEKPIIKVYPRINHKWVDSAGEIVLAPGLINFTIHSDLGRVVQVIRREFELDQSLTLANGSDSYSGNAGSINNTIASLSNDIELCSLAKLTSAELLRLNNNVDCLDEFISELPSIEASNKSIENTITKIMDLANSNMSKEESLTNLRAEISKQLEKIELYQASYATLSTQYVKLCEKYSPQSISDNLKNAALKCDEESERIAEQFLAGDMDCDKFLQVYVKSRTMSYTRKAKEERLSYQLKQLKKAGF